MSSASPELAPGRTSTNALVFSSTDRPRAAWSPELEDHERGNSDFHLWILRLYGTSCYQLNVHKSMRPDGIYCRVLKELVDVMVGPLSLIYQRSWQSGEVPADWNLASITPIYKKRREGRPRELQTSKSDLSPWKNYGEDDAGYN